MKLRGRRVIRVGSTVDTTHGTVLLRAATNNRGGRQQALIDGGAFMVTQSRTSATLTVRLTREQPLRSCSLQTGQSTRRLPSSVRARLRVRSRGGHVRSAGRSSSGTERGTDWTITDTCAGTTISVSQGSVDTVSNGAILSSPVGVGQSISYGCAFPLPGFLPGSHCDFVVTAQRVVNTGATTETVPSYLGRVRARVNADRYDLCVSGPGQGFGARCDTFPLSAPDSGGYRSGSVNCLPTQGPGNYEIQWRIAGQYLGPPLTYHTDSQTISSSATAAVSNGCQSDPVARVVPSGLTRLRASAHFVVHYSIDLSDPNAIDDNRAGAILQFAERSLGYEEQTLGMPAFVPPKPYLDSTPGKIDIYVVSSNLTGTAFLPWYPAGATSFPPVGSPTSEYLVLNGNYTVGHIGFATFGSLENAIGNITFEPGLHGWANWAGARFAQAQDRIGQFGLAHYLPSLAEPLDCSSADCGDVVQIGHWRFYQHLAESFGPTIVRDFLTADAALVRRDHRSHMDEALDQTLAAHGSSLALELSRYGLEDVANTWQDPWMQAIGAEGVGHLSTDFVTEAAPGGGGTVAPEQIKLRHLSNRVFRVTTAPLPAASGCPRNTLTLTVGVPPGGLTPGLVLNPGTESKFVLTNTAPSGSTVYTVTYDACLGVTADVVVTNGTVASDQLAFSLSAQVTAGAAAAQDKPTSAARARGTRGRP